MSVLGVFLKPEHDFSKTSQSSITLLKGLGVEGDCHLGQTTQHLWRMAKHASEPNLRQVHLIQSELFDEPDFHGEDGVRIQPGEMGENISTTGIDLLALSQGTRLHFVDQRLTQAAIDSRGCQALKEILPLFSIALILEVGLMTSIDGISWAHLMGAIRNSAVESVFTHVVGFWSFILGGACSLVLHIGSGSRSIRVDLMTCIVVMLFCYQFYTRHDYFGEHAVITITGLRHPCKKVDKFRPGLLKKCVVRGGVENRIIGRKAGVMAVVTETGIVKPGMKIVVETTSRFKELPVLH